jgi:hypothetical protein
MRKCGQFVGIEERRDFPRDGSTTVAQREHADIVAGGNASVGGEIPTQGLKGNYREIRSVTA